MTPTFIDPPGVWALQEDPVITPKIIEQKSFAFDEQHLRNEPEYQAILKANPEPVVFDVGAFIGYWSRMFLDDGFIVCAFEPYSDAFSCLTKNACAHPNAHRARCFNAPVGDGSPLSVKWGHMLNGNPGTRQTFPSKGDPSINLDQWITTGKLPAPHLVKIDVEGSEPLVLKGLSTYLNLFHPTLVIEIFPDMLQSLGFNTRAVFGKLESAGYHWRTFQGTENSVRWDIIASTKNQTR